MADKMLHKIALLLKQAERATTAGEADAFMEKAQLLATTNSIELALARQHTAKKEQREQPISKRITVGQARKGNLAHYCELFLAIASQNDVVVNLANNNTFVIAFGMPSDIEVVEVLYASLVFQMVEASNAWLKTGEYKKETAWGKVTKRDEWGDVRKVWVEKPVHGRVARANFYKAYTQRVLLRLADARHKAVEAATAPQAHETGGAQGNTSAALILRSKATEVDDFHKAKSTAKGTWKGSRTSTTSNTARTAGDNAGRTARLGTSKAIGGHRVSLAA
jgi:hypothetical protein